MDREWRARQDEMEKWYKDFGAVHDQAAAALEAEYRPLAELLTSMRGRVLDVGGGAGLSAMYLAPEVDYTVIDPGQVWADPEWAHIRGTLASRGPEPKFIVGTAENLPFIDGSFDAVLALWSLNHVADPERAIHEVHRVLVDQGKALFVVEDMEPTWLDVFRLGSQRVKAMLGMPTGTSVAWHHATVTSVKATALHKLSGKPWPIERDHLRILRIEMDRWLRGRFQTERASWRGGYLTYELERASTLSSEVPGR